MKKTILFLLTILHIHHTYSSFGTGADLVLTAQAIAIYQSQLNIVAPQPNTIINSCSCPVPPQAIPIPLPNFLITMQNYLGITINSFTFPTNANFKSRLAILTVQLFPPSNQVTTTTTVNLLGTTTTTTTGINTNGSENSYAIVYTLQSPDGLYFQKEIQYPTASAKTTFMQTFNGVPTVPTAMTINTSPAGATPLAQRTIIQSLAGLPYNTQQLIMNSISPITQKFFIATDNLGLNPVAIPMSGSNDPNSNLTSPVMTTSVVPTTVSTVPPIFPTTGTAIANITINLYNGTTPFPITFQQPSATQITNVTFNQADLINGLILHLYIYPPLYQNGPSSNNFNFIATLQTLDGLKFRKLVYQTIPFTNLPLTYTITASSLQGFTTTLTSSIASPIVTPQLFNMLSPIHIRFRLQQNDSNVVNISIT